MQLTNKTILVTGASSGIGQAIAIDCAKKGAKVFIHYRKNKAGASETLKQVANYSNGEILAADLTKSATVRAVFKKIGWLDVLINNAGEATPGDFDDMSVWKSQIENIFMSQVYASTEFLKLKQSDTKTLRKIINISSVYGISQMGNPDFPQYSAAKAAVISYTCNLAKKYAPEVLVNSVAPGYTWTPPWKGTSKTEKKACENLTRIKRFVTPAEIAMTVTAILENDAMTGEVVRVDGGLHLAELR